MQRGAAQPAAGPAAHLAAGVRPFTGGADSQICPWTHGELEGPFVLRKRPDATSSGDFDLRCCTGSGASTHPRPPLVKHPTRQNTFLRYSPDTPMTEAAI